MKKYILQLLALSMLLFLTACGKKDSLPDNTGASTISETTNASDTANSASSGISLPDTWVKGSAYYDYIDNVWDSSVLPSWFPTQTDGVKPAETTYKPSGKDTPNQSTRVAWISFDSMDFERYSVSFYATRPQVEDFIAQVDAAGMTGGFINDFPYDTYNYSGHGWVLEVYFNTDDTLPEDGEGEWDGCVSAIMAPVPYQHPRTFRGEPLPQCGLPIQDHLNHYLYTDNNYEDTEYDLKSDNTPIDGEYWTAWFEYCGCSEDDLRSYVQTLTDAGWTVKTENTSIDDDYSVMLEKGGVYMSASINHWALQIGISPLQENLSY